uniref:Uncharacterized protein n=1 Tax=Helianthus annuus TaxID=4232 RepID=A0A251TNL7_HELAN
MIHNRIIEPSKSYLYLLGGIRLGLNLYLAQVLLVIGWLSSSIHNKSRKLGCLKVC